MAFDTADSLLNVPGAWQVVVLPARILSQEEQTAGCPTVAGGPWTFDVTVP